MKVKKGERSEVVPRHDEAVSLSRCLPGKLWCSKALQPMRSTVAPCPPPVYSTLRKTTLHKPTLAAATCASSRFFAFPGRAPGPKWSSPPAPPPFGSHYDMSLAKAESPC